METWMIVTIILVVLTIATVALYIAGNKLQKKQMAQKEQIAAAAQPVTMLIIDKKIMKLKDANLPKVVMEQTPKRLRGSKLPIVKAKIGPQIMSLICDDGIFDSLPTKGEVKAMVSGIYIISVKNVRGKVEAPSKKKTFSQKLRTKQKEYQEMYAQETKTKEELKKEKEARKKSEERAKKIK